MSSNPIINSNPNPISNSTSDSVHVRAAARGVVDIIDPENPSWTDMASEHPDAKLPDDPDSTVNAFFYGTLMAPEVFFRVCYNIYNGDEIPEPLLPHHGFQPAVLNGYVRRRVIQADYPGITPSEKDSVQGIFVKNLTPQNVGSLDWFEGGGYERINANVTLLEKAGDGSMKEGEVMDVSTYVFKEPMMLEEKAWDYERFRRQNLEKWA